jgi:hypothetical protein
MWEPSADWSSVAVEKFGPEVVALQFGFAPFLFQIGAETRRADRASQPFSEASRRR